MKTIILASAAIATIALSVASVEAATVRHPVHVTVTPAPSSTAYGPNGYYLGSDPDRFVRGQIERDPNLGNQ
jgi:hypothetical protein